DGDSVTLIDPDSDGVQQAIADIEEEQINPDSDAYDVERGALNEAKDMVVLEGGDSASIEFVDDLVRVDGAVVFVKYDAELAEKDRGAAALGGRVTFVSRRCAGGAGEHSPAPPDLVPPRAPHCGVGAERTRLRSDRCRTQRQTAELPKRREDDMAVSDEEQMMIDTVAEFVDEQVKPHVNRIEHANEYPEAWIQTMKDMGIYGLAIDEPWGMGKVTTEAYALITQELAR